MKLEDVKVGVHKIGPFTISVQKPVFQEASEETLNYFCVGATQDHDTIDGIIFYVDLVKDERFAHFAHLQSFSRNLTEEDLAEYNAHVTTVFHGLSMPMFKLSRRSIVSIFDKCQALAKKLKKKK